MGWKIPSEVGLHSRTWMAWPWDASIWNQTRGTSLAKAQDTIECLARSISIFENVALIVRDEDAIAVERRFRSASLEQHQIEIIVEDYNDIWVRDTLPTFALRECGALVAVNWNFNGWGRRARSYASYRADADLCRKIAQRTGAELVDSNITAEGGAFVFDNCSAVITTKSVLLDKFRNPTRSMSEVEAAILVATGRDNVCWLPGDRHEPITLGHADAMMAFVDDNTVLVNWAIEESSYEYDVCDYNLRVMEGWAAKVGRNIQTILVPASQQSSGNSPCSSYINLARVNGAILVPAYGERDGDNRAHAMISEAHGHRCPIIAVDMRPIACAGGSIHCVTQQQPFTERSTYPNSRA